MTNLSEIEVTVTFAVLFTFLIGQKDIDTASEIIDLIEDKVRSIWKDVDKQAADRVIDGFSPNVLIHAEDGLEDEIIETLHKYAGTS